MHVPRLLQSTWQMFPGRPTPRPPAAITPVQFVSSRAVIGSSPDGQCCAAQVGPKYSGSCVSPGPVRKATVEAVVRETNSALPRAKPDRPGRVADAAVEAHRVPGPVVAAVRVVLVVGHVVARVVP